MESKRPEKTVYLESADSTNTWLKNRMLSGADPLAEDGTAVLARYQTAGRGRTGNSFASADGGMYLSMVIGTEMLELNEITSLTPKIAVAVSRALEETSGVLTGIKWVNDIILDGKKLGGILVEAGHLSEGRIPYVIAGIGINVNQESFPGEISDVAVSLKMRSGKTFSVEEIADAVLRHLDVLRKELKKKIRSEDSTESDCPDAYLKEYREKCVTTGRTVCFERNGVREVCTAERITEDYGLLVRHPDGTEEILRSGDVHVRGLEGYI